MIAPCLDRPTSELFFADHLHHFHSSQLEDAAALEGLDLVGLDLDHPALPGFALWTFAPDGGGQQLHRRESRVRDAVREWADRFRRVDQWLARDSDPIAVWGAGQSLALLLAYTDLEEARIATVFEDNPRRFAATSLSFPVRTLEEAPGEVARVLLTFPPQRAARARLEALGVDWYSPFP